MPLVDGPDHAHSPRRTSQLVRGCDHSRPCTRRLSTRRPARDAVAETREQHTMIGEERERRRLGTNGGDGRFEDGRRTKQRAVQWCSG
jgi:hypothetical protein